MSDKNNITKEQRSHDIAIQLIKHSLRNENSDHLDKMKVFEIVKYYEEIYSNILNSFEVNF